MRGGSVILFAILAAIPLSAGTAAYFTATPEPVTFGMVGLVLVGLGRFGRKRKQSS